MAKIETLWLSNQKSEITHADSGNKVTTHAPADKSAAYESFSPVDLVVAALSGCILTMMDSYALANAALTCPVGKSLHPELEKTVLFHFEDDASA